MALDLWAPIVSRLELLAADHRFKRLAKIRVMIVSVKVLCALSWYRKNFGSVLWKPPCANNEHQR
jgi:hypothetical protein